MPWKTLNSNAASLDNPNARRPARANNGGGLSRDRKARIADMLNELEPYVQGKGYDILRRLFNEVES